MDDLERWVEGPFKASRFLTLIAFLWTFGVVLSVVWNIAQIREQSLELAAVQARASFEKDIAYRRWIVRSGGVYVPVSREIPPNPNMAGNPERDVVTPSGKVLTLVNSAYMMRQIHEIARSEGGVLARITSLNPICRESRADDWEAEALREVEKGRGEMLGVQESDGKEHMRLVRPLVVEDRCKACHRGDDIRVGSVLGAISISVPMESFRTAEHSYILVLVTAHGLLWFLGISMLVYGERRIRRGEAWRKDAERTLRESERRYRCIVEDQTELVARFLPDGTMTFVNPACCRYFGVPEEEVLGTKFWECLAEEDRGEFAEYIASLGARRPVMAIEHRVVLPDGEIRWQQWTDRAILDEKGDVLEIQGVGRDITDRKTAQEALREAKEFLERIIGSVSDPLFVKDSEHRFVLLNSACCRVAGVDRQQDLIGRPGYDFLPEEQARVLRETDEEVLRTGAEIVHEETITGAVGINRTYITKKNRYIDGSGNRFVVSIARDITDRIAAETALRESEERYRSLVESSPEVIAVHRDGKYVYMNSAGAGLLGASGPSELIGRPVKDFVAPGYGADVQRRARRSGMHGTNAPLLEEKIVRLDGTTVDVEVVNMNIHYLGSPAVQVLMRDITERRRMEEEKTRMEAQLRQAQKIEAIGTLAGGVAHDFNNILAAIFGYVELALRSVPRDGAVRNHLEQVLRAAHRAKDLVRQILTYSRQCSDQERTPVDLGPIVKEIVKFLRASLPATIDIRQELAGGPHVALATPTQMHQVLLNLCTNALHAMEEKGGVLGINLSHVDLNGNRPREFPNLKAGPYLKLTVSDTGSGMDPAILERIFDPYFTTKEIGKGSGLGLAVVHGIVNQCEGAIGVRSEKGIGSVFSVLFPRIEKREIIPVETECALQHGREFILMVDDERILAQSCKQLLSHLGYRVSALADSRKALKIFARNPERFDLVITDYTMPAMTGEEFVRSVRTMRRDIPVILMSGFSERMTKEKIGVLDIAEFLMKPTTMLDLSRAVRRVLDGAGFNA
ncbi:MAG: PAS domain S-box protein [Syntrophobacteraceae bacterium]